jgi:hypothetical protein
MAEVRGQQEREDEERLKTLTPKERDEWKKSKTKPSGMQEINPCIHFSKLNAPP